MVTEGFSDTGIIRKGDITFMTAVCFGVVSGIGMASTSMAVGDISLSIGIVDVSSAGVSDGGFGFECTLVNSPFGITIEAKSGFDQPLSLLPNFRFSLVLFLIPLFCSL